MSILFEYPQLFSPLFHNGVLGGHGHHTKLKHTALRTGWRSDSSIFLLSRVLRVCQEPYFPITSRVKGALEMRRRSINRASGIIQ